MTPFRESSESSGRLPVGKKLRAACVCQEAGDWHRGGRGGQVKVHPPDPPPPLSPVITFNHGESADVSLHPHVMVDTRSSPPVVSRRIICIRPPPGGMCGQHLFGSRGNHETCLWPRGGRESCADCHSDLKLMQLTWAADEEDTR